MDSKIKKLIKYVEGLEKAYKLIDAKADLSEELKYKLKKVRDELGFIIEDIDEEYHEEFYGEDKWSAKNAGMNMVT